MPNLNSPPKDFPEFFTTYLHRFHFKVNFPIKQLFQDECLFICFIILIEPFLPFILCFQLFSKSKKVIKI